LSDDVDVVVIAFFVLANHASLLESNIAETLKQREQKLID
jgi:hypothetical protein